MRVSVTTRMNALLLEAYVPSDDPWRWEQKTLKYRSKKGPFDYNKSVHLGKFEGYSLEYLPYKDGYDDGDGGFLLLGSVLALTEDDEVVAEATVSLVHGLNGYSDVLTADIETREDHRRRGITTAALKAVEKHLKKKIVSPEVLGLHATPAGHAFFKTFK